MVKETKKKHGVALAGLIFIAGAAALWSVSGHSQTQIAQAQTEGQTSHSLPLETLQIFSEVFGKIKSDYVDEIDDVTLLRYAIEGMLNGLDPHSLFLEPEEFKKITSTTAGKFGGLGIEITLQNGVVKVIAPIDGSPAFDAGIQSGDLILMVDDVRVHGMSLNDAVKKMRGEPGSTVKLTISRMGEAEYLEIMLVRAIIKINSVKGELLEDEFGYVRLSGFHSGTVQSLRSKIKQLNNSVSESGDASGRLSGLVLDLRNNPGGILESAIAVSDLFLSEGEIVSTRGRSSASEQGFVARAGDIIDDAPMIVLVNGGSASASEIVAGALQDHRRAIILGSKTFGKGSVQTIIPMPNGNALKLTTARYYTPLNRSIQAKGIIPDIIVEQTDYSAIRAIQDEVGGDKNSRVKESDLVGHLENHQPKGDASKDDVSAERTKNDQQLREALNLLKGMLLTRRRTQVVGE